MNKNKKGMHVIPFLFAVRYCHSRFRQVVMFQKTDNLFRNACRIFSGSLIRPGNC